MKNKISVIGNYAENMISLNGQTVKTRIFYDELKKTNLYDINLLDTCGWKSNPIKLYKSINRACKNDDFVFMMNDYKGVIVLSKLLPRFVKKSNCKLVYVVIGGWIYDFLKSHPKYITNLCQFDAIICETQTLKTDLQSLGLENLFVVPNFKRLDVVESLLPVAKYPYRFCTFSRIFKEKGIEDAVECIKSINRKYDNDIVTLDIYGQIEENYKSRFKELEKDFPKYIRYKGTVDYDKSVDTLKNYYALLFPTTYYAECHAGTVIDAFASGLPVICYEWKYSKDLITHGIEGLVCKPGVENLVKLVEEAINDQDKMLQMRVNCVNKAKEYLPDVNIEKIIGILMQLQK